MYEIVIQGKVAASGFRSYGEANQWHDRWIDNWFATYGMDEEPPQAVIRPTNKLSVVLPKG